MIINSTFRDYYDSIKAFGIDKSVVYDRSPVVISKNYLKALEAKLGRLPSYTSIGEYILNYGVVGFCGELFPYVSMRVVGGNPRYYFKPDDLGATLKDLPVSKYSYSSLWGHDVRNKTSRDRYFQPNTWKPLATVFTDHRLPVFDAKLRTVLGTGITIETTPNLKALSFMKVKPPAQAFQEIMQYLSGVLGTPPLPPAKMSDKVMQYSKGFDHPYSFKKEPTKRRGKKA